MWLISYHSEATVAPPIRPFNIPLSRPFAYRFVARKDKTICQWSVHNIPLDVAGTEAQYGQVCGNDWRNRHAE
jgi:hypothetical protein